MTDTEPTNSPSSKAEIIQQISKALVERRKARGLSLEKIHQNIKIRIPYLEAMEKGEWDQLPGEVYVKGFLKRYADHLGFDSGKLLAPYLQFASAPEKKTTEYAPMLKGTEFTRIHLIGFGLAAILIVVLVNVVKHDRPLPPAKQAEPAPVNTAPSPVEEKPRAEETKLVSQPHRLDVFSPYPLWLRVASEDRNFEGFIPQGATWTWKGQGKFSVRLGHNRELSVSFDGKPVPMLENQKMIELPNEN